MSASGGGSLDEDSPVGIISPNDEKRRRVEKMRAKLREQQRVADDLRWVMSGGNVSPHRMAAIGIHASSPKASRPLPNRDKLPTTFSEWRDGWDVWSSAGEPSCAHTLPSTTQIRYRRAGGLPVETIREYEESGRPPSHDTNSPPDTPGIGVFATSAESKERMLATRGTVGLHAPVAVRAGTVLPPSAGDGRPGGESGRGFGETGGDGLSWGTRGSETRPGVKSTSNDRFSATEALLLQVRGRRLIRALNKVN